MLHSVIDSLRTEHPEWIVVRHVDMSRCPEDRFCTLCDSLGGGYNAPVAGGAAAYTATANPAEAESGRPHTLDRVSAASPTTWKSRLTADEFERLRYWTTGAWERSYGEDEW